MLTLTSAYTGQPIALHPDLVGEVKTLESRAGFKTIGRTLIIHLRNRRVHWTVEERFDEVMKRLEQARRSQAETADGVTPGTGPSRA